MARKRETGGVRKRGRVWWIYYRVDGKRYDESAKTGDERVARSLLTKRRREIREGTWKAPSEAAVDRRIEELEAELAAARQARPEAAPEVLTTEAHLEAWLAARRASGIRGIVDEERYLRVHVIPYIGALPLAEVTRAHVKDVVAKARAYTSDVTGDPLSARSILHLYRAMATAFNDAVLDGLIPASPCTLRTRKGELPKKRDKDPAWRSSAVYTRDEAEALISDPRIPLDRRVYYGMMLLGGLRSSEAAGRRWRDYDPDAAPLGRLVVATQADGATGDRETKTGDVRDVPVHPALAELLAEWKLRGFAMLFGRHPTPDDPIVPNRVDAPGQRRGTTFRSKHTLERLRKDLARLGLRQVPSGRHSMRSTFLSLLEVDGANMAIARRATHAAPADVVGGYIRVQWADVCREVAKLRIEIRRGVVIPLRKAVSAGAAGDSPGDNPGAGKESAHFSGVKAVGGTGFESAESLVITRDSGEATGTGVARKRPESTPNRTRGTQSVPPVTDPAVRSGDEVLAEDRRVIVRTRAHVAALAAERAFRALDTDQPTAASDALAERELRGALEAITEALVSLAEVSHDE